MASAYVYSKKRLSLAKQQLALLQSFSGSECYIVGHKKLVWKGQLSPSILSRSYPVVLEYTFGHMPKVRVSGEGIKKIDAPDFPHVFHRDYEKNEVEVCLCYGNEFTPEMLLADTYIPWAIEWLYFYEIWLVTGEWKGGGIHHQQKKPSNK